MKSEGAASEVAGVGRSSRTSTMGRMRIQGVVGRVLFLRRFVARLVQVIMKVPPVRSDKVSFTARTGGATPSSGPSRKGSPCSRDLGGTGPGGGRKNPVGRLFR